MSNLSCPLSSHRHEHAPEGMLHASPDCQLETIHFLGLVAKRMIASTPFVDQAFEATELQQTL
jgi:hypothetical protein